MTSSVVSKDETEKNVEHESSNVNSQNLSNNTSV